MLEVLLADRPHDLPPAGRAVEASRRRGIRAGAERLDPPLRERVLALLAA